MTTISTSSENLFSKIQKYLKNKRVGFTSSLSNEVYALTIFDLSDSETTTLIQKMTKHFHLTPRQQEPLALEYGKESYNEEERRKEANDTAPSHRASGGTVEGFEDECRLHAEGKEGDRIPRRELWRQRATSRDLLHLHGKGATPRGL